MKLFTFTIALMLVAMTAMAAEVPTSAGDKAMVFMFSGLDDLHLDGYGSDYGFGMRYYIADGTAIRAGIVFGSSSYTDEIAEMEYNYSDIGIEAVYEKHIEAPCASVSPYWGVGGGFMTWSEETKDTVAEIELIYSGTGFEVFGVAGFEWGFTDCMTLGGEYRLGFMSQSSEYELDGDSNDVASADFMGFGTASVYLSVYW